MSATDIHDPNRRDFLYVATGMAGVVGAGAVAWPFIDQMRPDASTLALASIEVDVAALTPGMSLTVKWRGKPVFIRNRTREGNRRTAKAVNARRSQGSGRAQRQSAADAPATDVDRSAGKDKENWIVMVGVLHPSRLRSARPGRRFRRLVLSVPRLALRYGRPHPQRPGAGEPGRADLRVHFRHQDPDRLRQGDISMSEGHSTYAPKTGIETLDRRAPAAAAAGL